MPWWQMLAGWSQIEVLSELWERLVIKVSVGGRLALLLRRKSQKPHTELTPTPEQ